MGIRLDAARRAPGLGDTHGTESGGTMSQIETLLDIELISELKHFAGERGDGNLFDELIEIFERETPAVVAQIQLAAQAGEARTLEAHAHRLKGSSANLGAIALSAACSSLELMARTGEVTEGTQACAKEVSMQFQKAMHELQRHYSRRPE